MSSPKSIEACKRSGIAPQELIKKSRKEIKDMFKQQILNEEGIDLHLKHYEEKRE